MSKDNDGNRVTRKVTNKHRADWATAALKEFCTHTGQKLASEEERREAVTDLLTDLEHWCGANGVDYIAAVAAGIKHYSYEIQAESIGGK